MYLEHLKSRLAKLKEIIDEGALKTKLLEHSKADYAIKISVKQEDSLVLLGVVELFKALGGEGEAYILEKVDKFISFALSRVFDDSYSFVSKMSVDGKDVRVDFFVKQNGELLDVVNARGGGVAEVVGLFIQIFYVVLGKNKFAPVLILDTALVHLSTEYVANMSTLLEEITRKLGIQIILLTHTGLYAGSADKYFIFKQLNGHTVVEGIR